MSVIFGQLPALSQSRSAVQWKNWLLARSGATVITNSVPEETNMVASNLGTDRRTEWWISDTIAGHLESCARVWQYDDSGGSYVDQTTEAGDATVDDWGFFPAGAGTSDLCYFGLSHQFTKLSVNVGQAGAGTYSVTWEYRRSDNTWAGLSVVDGTNSFKNGGTNEVTFTPPSNWATVALNGTEALYYIRAVRAAGTETTRPLGTQGWAAGVELAASFQLPNPRAFRWLSYHWSNNLLPWRVVLRDDAPDQGGQILVETDWIHPVVKSKPGDFSFREFPVSMCPNSEELEALAANKRLSSFVELPEAIYGVKHVEFRWDISGGANGLRDYLQVSHCRGGLLFQPSIDVDLGTSVDPVSHSLRHETAGGADEGVTRDSSDEITLPLANLTDTESMGELQKWIKGEGELARVFAYWRPEPERRRFFYWVGAVVGTAREFSGVVLQRPGYMNGAYITSEVRGITVRETQ